MKHFTPFIHLLRAAWEGDRQKAAEQVLALADQMEGEGDAAHARMLRFTLQSLQNQPPARDGHTLMKPAAPKAAPAAPPVDLDLGAPANGARPGTNANANAGTIALTFGTWDETKH
jgi:hypothetical protein